MAALRRRSRSCIVLLASLHIRMVTCCLHIAWRRHLFRRGFQTGRTWQLSLPSMKVVGVTRIRYWKQSLSLLQQGTLARWCLHSLQRSACRDNSAFWSYCQMLASSLGKTLPFEVTVTTLILTSQGWFISAPRMMPSLLTGWNKNHTSIHLVRYKMRWLKQWVCMFFEKLLDVFRVHHSSR